MPRMPRVVVPGLPLHVIQRGNNRQAIFFTDQDYDRFHTDLRTASERFDCVIHAYVYMTSHVHLLVTPSTRRGISRMMQSVRRLASGLRNGRRHIGGCSKKPWRSRYRARRWCG
jgi:putative transposase